MTSTAVESCKGTPGGRGRGGSSERERRGTARTGVYRSLPLLFFITAVAARQVRTVSGARAEAEESDVVKPLRTGLT